MWFEFCPMVHKGEILKLAIERSGVSKTQIHRKLRISRKTLYNYFERTDLPLEVFLDVGKIIHYSFSDDIPELRTAPRLLDSTSIGYEKMTLDDWKNKYIGLLEDHQQLLLQLSEKDRTIEELIRQLNSEK